MVYRPSSCGIQGGRFAAIRGVVCAAISFSVLGGFYGYAAEKWADPNLKVLGGLELWLDATNAGGDQTVPADGKLKQWRDASGKNRNVVSPDANAQPAMLKIGSSAIVRFDG